MFKKIYETDIIIEDCQMGVFLLDLWTGTIYKYPVTREENKSRLHLIFEPYGSKILLLTNEFNSQNYPYFSIQIANRKPIKEYILNKWHLVVDQRAINGTTESIEIDLKKPMDWRKIPKLKYCSGPGVYTTSFSIQEESHKDSIIYLNLGNIQDIAKVKINGHDCGERIIPPYLFDVSSFITTSEIKIEVTVAVDSKFI
jgi:hypothetical protein